MKKPTKEEIEWLFDQVEDALIQWVLNDYAGEHSGNGEYHKLVIEPSGEIRTQITPGMSRDPDEHFSVVPHELTIIEIQSESWTPGPGEDNPGWEEDENGELDLTRWCGPMITAEDAEENWREILQHWIDKGNFRPV
jgi:hypothetical protein